MPHLLYTGKWSSFIIQVPRGKFLLFYEDDPTPIFEWINPNPSIAFLPMYYYYGTEVGNAVGFAFDRDLSKYPIIIFNYHYYFYIFITLFYQVEIFLKDKNFTE